MAIDRTFQTPCQSCAGLTRELYRAIFIHIQVNIALYGYTQDLPDTLSVLRRVQRAISGGSAGVWTVLRRTVWTPAGLQYI